MKELSINNQVYRRMLSPESLAERVMYLDFMIDFYFEVMCSLKNIGFKNQFRAQMSTMVQMMFMKGKSMRILLDGFSHSTKNVQINGFADHTILFTLVRAAFEQLCAFELVYLIPDTEDKRIILENTYIAAAQVNRLKMFTEESLSRYPDETQMARQDIEQCKNDIRKTVLYQSLTEKEQKVLEEQVFKKGEYQIVFTDDGKLKLHVGWDEVRNYCKLSTTTLHGVYKYACNMAHPSYLGLCQFYDSYKEGAIEELNHIAVMQMIGIFSVFIMDFIKAFPEVGHVYSNLDEESKFMVRMYSEGFRDNN